MSWVLQSACPRLPDVLTKKIGLWALQKNHGMEDCTFVWSYNKTIYSNGQDIIRQGQCAWLINNILKYIWFIQESLIKFDYAAIDLSHIIDLGTPIIMDTQGFEDYISVVQRLRFYFKQYAKLIHIVNFYKISFPHPFNYDNKDHFYTHKSICNKYMYIGDPRALCMLGDMVSGVTLEKSFEKLCTSMNYTNISILIDTNTDWFIMSQF